MTSTSRVTSTPAAAPAPSSSATTSTRAPAFGQEHAVEGVASVSYVTRFETEMDFQSGGQGHFSQRDGQQRDPYAVYLNGVGKFAVGWVANETASNDTETSSSPFAPFLSDALHGVGVYETNLRVVAGNHRTVGQSLSFYL